MQDTNPTFPPAAVADWLAGQQGLARDQAEACQQAIAAELQGYAHRLAAAVAGAEYAGREVPQERICQRLWACLEYHWRRFAAETTVHFTEVVRRLEAGELGYEGRRTNLLMEVALAQALEDRESGAARMFEQDYMPTVRGVAHYVGGSRGLDAVDNFTAELILPREEGPPPIASYRGRTPLRSWLRSVVINHWVSHARRKKSRNLAILPESATFDDGPVELDERPCEELLRPMFAQAVAALTTEDRVLIKMLILDGASQQDLAVSWGVVSGTLTRRRQRAAAMVLEQLHSLAKKSQSARRVEHCLEVMLTENDSGLRHRLAEVLAAGVRRDPQSTEAL